MIYIAIATDHRGYEMKEWLKKQTTISSFVINWVDVGTYSKERCDYPPFGIKAVEAIRSGQAHKAVLLCGTGIGMAIVANRFTNIYAAVVWDELSARLSKEDDNANILALPADFINNDAALKIFDAWLSATFKEGIYQKRLELIDKIDAA